MNKIYYLSKYIVLLGFFLFAQQNIFAVPPTQLLPQDNDDCVSLDATFRWTSNPSAAYYMYIISTKSDFSDTLTKNLNYNDTVASYQLPNNSTDYYWKVGVHIIGQTDEWSDGFKLTTSPAPPSLLAPSHTITCQDFEQTYSWNSVDNAIEYKIQISKLSNFGLTVLDSTISATTLTYEVKDYFQDYFWRVKARVPGCETDWSDIYQFRTIVGPPSISSPADSANGLPLAITLSWPSAPGANDYDLQVSDDENFSNLLVDEMNTTQLSFNFNSPNSNKRYWWRLRTNGQGCSSVWSEAFTFITAFPITTIVGPKDPDKCVPINTEFVWNTVAGANKYHVQAAKTENFGTDNDILFEDKNVVGTSVIGNVKEATSRIYWRVRVNNDDNIGLWSEINDYFTTGDAPIAVSPEEGEVEVPRGITINWTSLGPIQSSHLQVATDPDFSNKDIDEAELGDTKLPIVLSSYNTQYYYRIRTTYNGCESEWSNVVSFKSIQGFPDLISPADGDFNIPVNAQLEWSEVPTAITYDYRIATKSDFSDATGQNGISTNNFLVQDLETNTLYYWMVRSNDQWGTSPWSPVFEFSTGFGVTNVPVLISPERNAVKIPTDGIMNWRKSENATMYHLQVATDRNFGEGTIVINDLEVADTVYNYTGLDSFTEYWFRVASVNETVKSDFSSANKFRTIAIAPSDMALAINPTDEAKDVPFNQIKFEWTEVARTDLGLSSESGYELLLSDKQDYSDTLIYNTKIGEESKIYSTLFTNGTTYFWKVRGWNEAGFGPWSESFSFTTDAFTSVADGNYFNFGTTLVPNPIQNNAELRFELDKPGTVNFTIVDQSGREVYRLTNISANSKQNTIPLNFDNLINGTYLFNLQVGDKYQTGKIIISR